MFSRFQKLPLLTQIAWVYSLMFFSIVVISHIPQFNDTRGFLFGIFHIDPIDDVIHLISFLWAAFAAWRGLSATKFYFKAFGLYYTTDAIAGLFTGYTLPQFLTYQHIYPNYDCWNIIGNFPANAPHFVIGPAALFVRFILGKRVLKK